MDPDDNDFIKETAARLDAALPPMTVIVTPEQRAQAETKDGE